MDIKEESSFLDFSLQNERQFFLEHPLKVKIETVISSSDIKSEPEDSLYTQDEQPHLLKFNEIIKENEIETRIDIKEEDWLERADSCVNDDIKNETHENVYSIKPSSFSKEGVSTYTSDSLCGEDSGNDMHFNMIKDGPECKSGRKGHRQDYEVIAISSAETSVCSERSNDRTIFSWASSLKQGRLLQQSNTNKQNIIKENCNSVLSHEYRNSYECDVPEKCLKYPSHSEKHKLVLDSEEPNNCDIWGSDLNRLSSTRTHKLIDVAKRTHKCNICDKGFTQLSHLRKHKLIHEGIKPHKCNICNKSFTQLSDLNKHKLIHEGIKPHKCNTCNKAFTQLQNLKKHKLIHEGIKPHKCNICNKSFTASSSLKKHKYIHEGIKPHKCNVCNKAFTHTSHLKTHNLIHQGIKPHKCNTCNKGFTQLSDLKKHKLIHEGIKPHKCNICNRAFTRLSSSKRHMLIHKGSLICL